jgi:hypothetical protein
MASCGVKNNKTQERERESRIAVKGAPIVGFSGDKNEKVKRTKGGDKKKKVTIDLFNTDRWFLSQGLQVVCPLEDAKQQAVIAVLQQPAKFRVPGGTTLASRSEFCRMTVDLSFQSLYRFKQYKNNNRKKINIKAIQFNDSQ